MTIVKLEFGRYLRFACKPPRNAICCIYPYVFRVKESNNDQVKVVCMTHFQDGRHKICKVTLCSHLTSNSDRSIITNPIGSSAFTCGNIILMYSKMAATRTLGMSANYMQNIAIAVSPPCVFLSTKILCILVLDG